MNDALHRFRRDPSAHPSVRRARIWFAVVAVVVVAAFVIQIWLVLAGGPDPNTGDTVATVGVAVRLVQTVSFFTIQSNLLVLVLAVTLVANPCRDGRWWRVLQLDALVGITVTGIVFDLVLIHYVHPSGWQLVATIGFHYIAPWATVLGWFLFGPGGRIDRRTVARACLWPAAWVVYTFVHGALTGWYPYPFLDAHRLGLWPALRNTGVVLVLEALVLAVFWWRDHRRAPAAVRPYGQELSGVAGSGGRDWSGGPSWVELAAVPGGVDRRSSAVGPEPVQEQVRQWFDEGVALPSEGHRDGADEGGGPLVGGDVRP
ncbi:Pr6Pr family membrane protein [Nakamurella endophytica]|uniref:F420-dependent oxidoreductase n=1 Tax=Nakamurella endophytica TaxID=1748367 RepID=A0A917WBK8_9ACTN|nr:Pr6Pr family membrane protein [Nakamurella endophytica]GGL91805.1 hypothetical protein GCM10011594_09490 [Nakamurella endophytica]